MARGQEGLAGDLGQESGCDPDADSGHPRQGRVKRVRRDEFSDLGGYFVPLAVQRLKLLGEAGQHGRGCACSDDCNGLLAERGDGVGCELVAYARRVLARPGCQPRAAG